MNLYAVYSYNRKTSVATKLTQHATSIKNIASFSPKIIMLQKLPKGMPWRYV